MPSQTALLLAAVVLAAAATAAKPPHIVLLGYPSATSHHMILAKIGREMKDRNAEVTFIRTDLDSPRVDVSGLNVHVVPTGSSAGDMKQFLLDVAAMEPIPGLLALVDRQAAICEAILADETTMEIMKSADMTVVDPSHMCALILHDKFNVKARVDVIPVGFYDPLFSEPYGTPNPLSYVPQLGTRLLPGMDFGGRVKNLITWAVHQGCRLYIERVAQRLRDQVGVSISNFDSINKAGIALYQTSWVLEFPRPVAPSAAMVGPLLPEPAATLEGELAEAVESSRKGIVLVSFGSIAQISKEQAQRIADAVGDLPGVTVIWKRSGEMPDRMPENVKVMDWVPQNDLLGHPRCLAALLHGGANGMLEAAYHGVPVAGLPLFADQWDNVLRAVEHGMAVMVDKDAFTAESLRGDLQRLLKDPSYRASAAGISRVLRDQPAPPVAQAADWIQYALRHDGAEFRRLPAAALAWFPNWDVYAFLGLVEFLVLWGLYRCLRGVYRRFFCGATGNKDKAKKNE